MINFSIDAYGFACPKCGLTTPWQVEFVRRPSDWGATSSSMNAWRQAYRARYNQAPPSTGRDEWLLLVCDCGFGFEMKTADA